ncbi:hypothetical protein N7493_004537 [Penicillium malachiteum]|uniref:Uncharacterized protein n=1 Tax=Penicillium malachiteum TaxID=1324776 RepID=A0AAD6HNR4_9EURO|nr:hypothetical protein N7493_004537 [Penicillium malachiteum]
MQYSALFMSTLVALASAQSSTPSATSESSGSSATQAATTLSSKTSASQTSSASSESTTVVSIFEAVDNDSGYTVSWYTSLGASIIGLNVDYTTYEVDCLSGAPTTDCSVNAPYTVVAGPTTLSYSRSLPVEAYGATVAVTMDVACSFTHSTESAVCKATEWASYEGQSSSTSTTMSYATNEVVYKPLTITAGLDKLSSPQATETPNAADAPHRPLVTAAPLGAAAIIAVVGLL